MTGIKPSSHGIVVDHKESGVRYAVSDRNYNEKIHRKVRDLRPGETVLGYKPKRREASEGSEGAPSTDLGTTGAEPTVRTLSEGSEPLADASAGSTQTEGANKGTQEKKEGN